MSPSRVARPPATWWQNEPVLPHTVQRPPMKAMETGPKLLAFKAFALPALVE